MLTDKREILHIKSYFSKHANEEIILEIIEYCIAIFNSAVGKNFLNMQNLKIEFFNLEKQCGKIHGNTTIFSIIFRKIS